MSLMHQALNRSIKPATASGKGFNPLRQTNRKKNGRNWWIITAVALPAAVILLLLPRQQLNKDANHASISESQGAPLISAPDEPGVPVQRTSEAKMTSGPVGLATETTQWGSASASMAAPSSDKPAPGRTPAGLGSAVDNGSAPKPFATAVLKPTAPRLQASRARGEAHEPMRSDKESEAAGATGKLNANPTEAFTIAADKPERRGSPRGRLPERPDIEKPPVSSVATAIQQHDWTRQAVQTAISRSNVDRARELLSGWIAREPTLEEPRLWLAKVYIADGRDQEAEALLIGLISPEALGLRGLILEQSERFADAARVFERLTRDDSANPKWWLHWAINLENSGRVEEARLLYQTYLQQFSSYNGQLTAFAGERYRSLAEF